ncbi:uncharacterized protein METZ01_LOCUS185415, partial [marine metagenome]
MPPLEDSPVESSCWMNPFVLPVDGTYHLYYAGGGKDDHSSVQSQ